VLDHWYRLTATTRPAPGGVRITATVEDSEDGDALLGALETVSVYYPPSVGFFGLHANRALTYFSYFSLSEAP
jgi:hypothetical protein